MEPFQHSSVLTQETHNLLAQIGSQYGHVDAETFCVLQLDAIVHGFPKGVSDAPCCAIIRNFRVSFAFRSALLELLKIVNRLLSEGSAYSRPPGIGKHRAAETSSSRKPS